MRKHTCNLGDTCPVAQGCIQKIMRDAAFTQSLFHTVPTSAEPWLLIWSKHKQCRGAPGTIT